MEESKKIYLDANVFLAAGNAAEEEHEVCLELLRRVQEREVIACTAALTIDEVVYIAKKYSNRTPAIATGFALVNDPLLEIIPVTRELTREALELMENTKLEPRDAIHVAAAVIKGATTFVTLDRSMPIIKGIRKTDDLNVMCKVCNCAYSVKQKYGIDFLTALRRAHEF